MEWSVLLLLCNAVFIGCSNTPPHIIMIIGDDMGWNDFGFHGQNQIPTPNLDALAYNGVILNRMYTQQYCTPSRAAILTGNYPIKSGMQGIPIDSNEDRGLPENMPTMAEQLKKLGYKTHLVGKWHLGSSRKSFTPTERGFDTFFGFWNGFMGYFDYNCAGPIPACRFANSPSFLPNSSVPCEDGFDLHDGFRPAWEYQGRYLTDLLTEKTIDVIHSHNKSEPLFLYLGHLAAHSGKNSTGLEVPDIRQNNKDFWYIKDERRRRFAGMVKELDDSIGKTMEALQNYGMLENSIIFFVSDNGPQSIGIFSNKGSAWPFRGLKFTGYEGGVRASAIMYSPLIKKRGHINNELMHLVDLLPTLYSAAGGKVSDLGAIDGIDQWSVITNGERTKRDELLIYADDILNISAILGPEGRYKLLNNSFGGGIYDSFYGDNGRSFLNPPYDMIKVLLSKTNIAINRANLYWQDYARGFEIRHELDYATRCNMKNREESKGFVCRGLCLFDLFSDPCETKNIAADRPDIVKDLSTRMSKYWGEIFQKYYYRPTNDSLPSLCNGTWFMWKDSPPFCPKWTPGMESFKL